MKLYVFVLSQPVELKLDSELEDISRYNNLYKKKTKKNTRTHIFRWVPMRLPGQAPVVSHRATDRDLRCLTLWKSQPL